MVEIPDYLLERSREARARLSGAPPGDSQSDATETAVVAVIAAKERKKIPVWMAPVALFLPIWAFMIWGTLEAPSYDTEGPIAAGGAVYAQCSACHGAGGGGGVGYQLNDGEVLKTFPDVESHVAWVVNGSSAAGTPYGNPDREGGQRISQNQGVMPNFAALESYEILEVVLYERVTHGLQDASALEAYVLWIEAGDLPDWEVGVSPQSIFASFLEFLEMNPEAKEAYEENLEEASG